MHSGNSVRTIEIQISTSNLAAALEPMLTQFKFLAPGEYPLRVKVSRLTPSTDETIGLSLSFNSNVEEEVEVTRFDGSKKKLS